MFGIDAMPKLYEIVENLPQTACKRLRRQLKHEVKTTPRARPTNVKEQVVKQREFKNIRLVDEHIAEFQYSPTLCKKTYRVVVVWKDLEVTQGQQKLFDDAKCFFYITNDRDASAEEIVFEANDRCNQENLIAQHKGGVRSLTAAVAGLWFVYCHGTAGRGCSFDCSTHCACRCIVSTTRWKPEFGCSGPPPRLESESSHRMQNKQLKRPPTDPHGPTASPCALPLACNLPKHANRVRLFKG